MNLTTYDAGVAALRAWSMPIPFHPDLRELVGKFKENDGFQQTRGVIRLDADGGVGPLEHRARLTAKELIYPYDIDLNVDETGVRRCARSTRR
ncbi:MAG: hypothetical protein V9G04_11885 [Nocardioides sp.]